MPGRGDRPARPRLSASDEPVAPLEQPDREPASPIRHDHDMVGAERVPRTGADVDIEE
jgi:hypothetical protein